jgi:hypothetical protein
MMKGVIINEFLNITCSSFGYSRVHFQAVKRLPLILFIHKSENMKNLILLIIVLCFPLSMTASPADEAAIRKVIQEAYIDGLQNLGDIQKIRDGFHPDFEMLLFRNGQMSKMDIHSWIERVEQRKSNPDTPRPNISGNFVDFEIMGTVAVVKLELLRDGTKIFTDYLSLYRFDDGWKIVSKVYYQH